MAIEIVVAMLLAQTVPASGGGVVRVEVRNGSTREAMPRARVHMRGVDEPRRPEITGDDGRATFSSVTCSTRIKFWARMVNTPNFNNWSEEGDCNPRSIIPLKIYPDGQ